MMELINFIFAFVITSSNIAKSSTFQIQMAGHTHSNIYPIYDNGHQPEPDDIIEFKTGHWMTTKLNSSLDYHFYSDISKINSNIHAIDPFMTVYGNIIFCMQCNNKYKIGPSNSNLLQYAPIAINTNFNLNDIIIHNENSQKDILKMYAFMHIIYDENKNSETDIINMIQKKLFPRAVNMDYESDIDMKHGEHHIISKGIMFTAEYNDLNVMYKDTKAPMNWEDIFNEYYFVPSNMNNDVIIYLYGLSVECFGTELCDKYLQRSVKVSSNKRFKKYKL
eukprot:69788_1